MNRSIRYLFVPVLCLLSYTSAAQVPELVNDPAFRSDAVAAADSIYNLNPDAADAILKPWKEQYPEHPIWTFFDGMKFWWEVLSDLEDTSRDEKFFYMMKKADYESSQLLRRNNSHVDGLIVKAVSNGFLARQYANREQWLTSLNYGRQAMKVHEYLMDVQPGLADLKLAEGLKLYYLAYLPEAYPVVKTVTWTMPDGDRQKGLDFLEEASEEAILARAEAVYFLGNIYHNYEKDYAAATGNFEKLYKQFPNNSYYVRLLVKNYYKMNSYDEALEVIDSTLARWEREDLPHKKMLQEDLYAWKGRILDRRNQKEEALEHYRRAFEISKELPATENRSNYLMSGYFAGKILYERGEPKEAEYYLSRVTNSRSGSPYKKQAQKLLSAMQ